MAPDPVVETSRKAPSMPAKEKECQTVIYLVRHARSEWNGTHRVTGQLNPDLSTEGLEQVRWLARLFANMRLHGVYASDLSRSVDTAFAVASGQGLTVEQLPGLRELHFGVLQGRFRDERDPNAHAMWRARNRNKSSYRAPGSEVMSDLAARVIPCVDRIRQEMTGRNCLIVGHRSTNRVILGTLMGWPREDWWPLRLRSRWVYEIRLSTPSQLSSIRLTAGPPYRRIDGLKT